MIRTIVINLDRDTERMAYMDAQLRALGIPYERQRALRGEEIIGTDEYHEDLARAAGHNLLPGELGCAASHKRIYERILREELPYALILEDDVELPYNFKEIIQQQVAATHPAWEYLLFDYWQPGIPFIRRWLSSSHKGYEDIPKQYLFRKLWFAVYFLLKAGYIIPMSLFEGLRNFLRKRRPGPVVFYRPLYLAGAYLVSNEGARKLLSLSTPIVYTADKLPNQARIKKGLRFFAFAPLCVRQRKEQFGSSILGMSGADL
ncbi:MAG TPA: glycosyltransferase family 25 protein [Candidatus Paceibacterota bacterium]|nr:glycosyltransferase family 25 protein [Candidatus Paceibacterota bacterium]